MRQLYIKYNYSSRMSNEIKYIVVHDTGNTASSATAYNHYVYFNSRIVNASAHYFVDDREIINLVPDVLAAWHCGDGKGRYGITNQNSLGVEMCINKGGDRDRAKHNTLMLIHYLMVKHNIPKERVVRHYDASRKCCPKTMSAENWAEWNEFYNSI